MRVYIDENFSPALVEGLRRIQEGRRTDDITVCSVIEEFGRGAPDETWIPSVASRNCDVESRFAIRGMTSSRHDPIEELSRFPCRR